MPDRIPAPFHPWRPSRPWLARLVWPLLLGLMGMSALLVGPARAGTLPGELPGLVGRLHVLSGSAQLMDRDSGRWQDGDNGGLDNWPVAAGDRLRLGRDARADLRIGSTTLRLGGGAQLWLQQLDEQGVVLQLQEGSLALRLAAIDGDAFGPVEVRTREGRWLPRRPGHYRFDRETDATQASVWRGELQFEGHDSALTIPGGRRADLWLDGPDNGRRAATRYAWAPVERDNFADWVARDERHDDAPVRARHVPPGITGWQDLDRHGDWISDADNGPLWLPRVVAPGWAPYQVGRWAWVSPWGWTWIDAAPWGFAPFHYGSWLRFDGRWAWSPGPRGPHGFPGSRVRYAPALSAWIGGPAVGVTVQIGGQRPPPPQVVLPPVVVVRPWQVRPPPAPVVVVVPPRRDERPEPHWNERRDDRWHDRGDTRRDVPRAAPWDDHRDDRRNSPRSELRDAPRSDRPAARDDRPVGRDDRPAGREGRPQVPAVPPATVVPTAPVVPVAASPVATPPVAQLPVAQLPAAQRPDVPRMAVPRPAAHAPQPAEAAVGNPAQRGHDGPGQGPGRVERPDRPDRADNDGRRDGQRGAPSRGFDRDLAR